MSADGRSSLRYRSIILSNRVLDLPRSQVLVVVLHLVPTVLRLLAALVSRSLSLLQSHVEVDVAVADRLPVLVRMTTGSLDDVALYGECLCDVHLGRVFDVEFVGGALPRLAKHLGQDARRLGLLQIQLHERLVQVHPPRELTGVPRASWREVDRLAAVKHLSRFRQSRLGHDVAGRPHHFVVVLPLLGRHSVSPQRVRPSLIVGANRLRTRSGSEGRRSRLISGVSGVSDVFDELYDQAQTLFTHDGLMDALDNLPSEGSSGVGGDRARTPEAPLAPLAGTVKFCTDCGCECQPYNKQWRCTSKFCLKLNGAVESSDNHNNHRDRPSTSSSSSMQQQQPSTSRQYIHHDHTPRKVVRVQPNPPPVPNPPAAPSTSRLAKEEKKEEEEEERRERGMGGLMRTSRRDDFNSSIEEPSPGRIKRKTVRISPPPPPVRSPTRRGAARPLKYSHYSKVEKTPPVSENGLRICSFCGGQVRPQMCGGNKHRWRCVDKKCRKWYGWVKTSDEIPKDINKKNLGASPDKSSGPGSVDASPVPEKKRLGRPPKHQGLKIRLGTTKKELEAARPKRKYTKRKDREAAALAEGILLGPDGKKLPKAARALSPLSQREASFRPSTLQRRSRWWTAEKRRNDYSPPRAVRGDSMDAAASFRLISQAMRACSVTASNSGSEPGSVAGAMDLLMDSLCASMAPLISLLNQFPRFAPTEEINESLWDSSLVHTPIFQ